MAERRPAQHVRLPADRGAGRSLSAIAAVSCAALAAVLAIAVLQLDRGQAPGLAHLVEAELDASGVSHPVTAVLLNFRAWDTLLELTVLLAAAVAVLAVRGDPQAAIDARAPQHEPMVAWAAQHLVPVMVLVGVFVLALGTIAPGGAFQGGAVLAAALVTLHLSGRSVTAAHGSRRLRGALVAGPAAFMAVALAGPLQGGLLLRVPPAIATEVIVAVETAATVSIAVTLALLFVAALPEQHELEDGEVE